MANSDSSARDSARGTREPRDEGTREGREEDCSGRYCLEGWVFLGSIGPEGEDLYEALRCRRYGGAGRVENH